MMSTRLSNVTSPYLRQHADNPVDWYPWGDEALTAAREQQLPILLSIGYSACHWCHVMAHESFEDESVAAVMNQHFINIKVDREERPDLDRIYQQAHQILTQRSGGWPLTIFLDPDDLTPFFAGTYFPKAARYGMPAFPELLQRIAEVFVQQRDTIREQNGNLRQALASLDSASEETEPATMDSARIDQALASFKQHYDSDHGGLGGAPKFPRPGDIRYWLQQAARGSDQGRDMALHTLQAMAAGGLYDHLQGGFFRYCVDQDWTIPHFEKMLYDNAQLIDLYAQAAVEHQRPEWRLLVNDTADWASTVLGLKQSLGTAVYGSSLDADSPPPADPEAHNEEGAFYVWSQDELGTLIPRDDFAAFHHAYGLDRPPNFEDQAWHLRRFVNDASVAKAFSLSDEALKQQYQQARTRLARVRQQRPPPGLDDKVLTAWNGLMIHGLARAGRLLGDEQLVSMAADNLDGLVALVWRDDQLHAVHARGQTHSAGLLEDHAYLLQAIMALLQCRFRSDWLQLATALAEQLLQRFAAADQGGFFMTPHDHETLIARPRPYTDDALPAGNAVAIEALAQLGSLLGEVRYLQAAEAALQAGWTHVQRHPIACSALLSAADQVLRPAPRLLLSGPMEQQQQWRAQLVLPAHVDIYAIPPDEPLPSALQAFQQDAQTRGYWCAGMRCLPPVDSTDECQRLWTELSREPS
ncbi:MAG: thioredoxin domain-containing protein [Wenzhouxiangellaceae bacterium]